MNASFPRPNETGVPGRVVDSDWTLLVSYLELTKPRVTLMVIVTALAGFYLASAGPIDYLLLFHALLGTALVASGTAALNQYMEREADGQMLRTRGRPLPTGKLLPASALVFGMVLVIGGTLYLLISTNLLTASLAWCTAAAYLLLYTPLKTRTTLSTLIGAFPGAVPPMMGWAAVRGQLDMDAWILFAILFAWQFPHFLAISWIYKDDYRRGGFVVLPMKDPEGRKVGRQVLIFCVLLLVIGTAPFWTGLAGAVYLVSALLLGLAFLWSGLKLASNPSLKSARTLLRSSLFYLPMLLTVLAVDKL